MVTKPVKARKPRTKSTKSTRSASSRSRAAAVLRVKFSPHSTGYYPGSTSSSSSSSAGGGGSSTVVVPQYAPPQLPPPSTGLQQASPFRGGPDVDDLKKTIARLEREATQRNTNQERQYNVLRSEAGRLNAAIETLHGRIDTRTREQRQELLDRIDQVERNTGVNLRDLRNQVRGTAQQVETVAQEADQNIRATRGEVRNVARAVDETREGVENVARAADAGIRVTQGAVVGLGRRAADEIAATNQRVIGLQQETGAVGNAVVAVDNARVRDVQTLAGAALRTQQDIDAEQVQRRAGELNIRTDMAQGMGNLYRMGQAAIDDLMGQVNAALDDFEGLRTPQGPGEGVAGGIAVMSGGGGRHLAGGLGDAPPQLVGPSNQIENPTTPAAQRRPRSPEEQTPRTRPRLPGPSNQLENGGVGDDMMDDL